ncbi:preprotein translocase subunit SecA [Helicobacter monodelphidis]|uniref:preprotein translocase subunit SecA n=1 Tax=Helicobacter sp. 15-1451 TaxID=2004995 RepID=UPI000DCD545B|nr:preprotein translocase subunit SecA [Helicobacter sp. 15-1451]RAX58215.1 preprotein translocase subunit SecA [Helicobacter sp. 15-1451]
MIKRLVQSVLGTRNDKIIKKYSKRVAEINALEPKMQSLSDEELQQEFAKLKQRAIDGENLTSLLVPSFAITRESSRRILNMRHFDVQLIGGMVLHDGRIAEMKTGEGKTLVATLAVVLNAMSQKGVHVVTVNDYLATRDATELKPLYEFLGYSVGIITSNLQGDEYRIEQYKNPIVYGTNNEFGFDYLRDNMKYSLDDKVQNGHSFVIVDEVDSILIDEARTPLIISGPANRKLENYKKANEVALLLVREEDFSVDEKNRVILLNENGIKKAEEKFQVENLYSIDNAILSHHLDQALKANHLFLRDKDYVVQDGEVIIVDEFTGRLSIGRRFSEGLHQALEAKEGVEVKEESQTLADITFQNYFRLYNKLAGMTGTAQTEATEFLQIYKLEVISIPTNVPIQRKDLNDLVYGSEKDKFKAVIQKIKSLHKNGQPVLVGTASIEKSEVLHSLLQKERIPHTVLNAKQHAKEAEIIKNAGVKGAVTIATNMAGRGVDIKINDEIRALGGLYIIGTERHESRRIDNQLRGRSGRQGDPGVSQFYLSLEDNLLRIFGSDRIKNIMQRLGLKEGEHIESKMITRSVEGAQKKVETMHFESRKHLLEYDDVANEQRKAVYRLRNELLTPDYDLSERIIDNRLTSVEALLQRCEIFEMGEAESYDYEKLQASFLEEYSIPLESKDLQIQGFEELKNSLVAILQQHYEEKFSIAVDQRSEIERIIYLQVLDGLWREHLYLMDNLKTGIGLRGYNQKDPLVEYKKESYNLFLELIENIKLETIKTLHSLRLRHKEESEEQIGEEIKEAIERSVEQLEQGVSDAVRGSEGIAKAPPQKKISRNDPCPCGSGKKYKNCCGLSGPKKGILAQNMNLQEKEL